MGSDSDWPVMREAAEALREFDVPFEADVVSAHRMPHEMIAYGSEAAGRGLKAIIAGAGGAAHLPGPGQRGGPGHRFARREDPADHHGRGGRPRKPV
ncbi:AIR carboxylase family protein, partial [Nocardiopsis alba]|uniref:AIR carboxylase family protein n=1 Tax=Nocardiopsis alba TaxID=53437 RepID=UPI003F4D0BA7